MTEANLFDQFEPVTPVEPPTHEQTLEEKIAAIARSGDKRNKETGYDPNRTVPTWAVPAELPQEEVATEPVTQLPTRTEDEGSRADFPDNNGGTFNMLAKPQSKDVALEGLALAKSTSRAARGKYGKS